MPQTIQSINPALHIGLVSWREAWLLHPAPGLLNVEVDKGWLVRRDRG